MPVYRTACVSVASIMAAPALDPAARQLRQYLVYAGTPNLMGAAGLFTLYVLYGNSLLLVWTAGTLINATLYLVAYRRVVTHGAAAAAPIICYGMWALVLSGAFTEGRAFPISILMTIMPVIAVVPYVPLNLLLRLCIAATGLIIFYAVMVASGLSPVNSGTIPDQSFAYLTNWGIVICVAVGGLSLWHTFGELNRELRKMTAANNALHASGKNLEARVTQRSAELQQSFAQLTRVRDSALASSRHKSVFLANMSHELRTPLNAILGFSQALSSEYFGPLSPRQQEYVKDIHHSGQQLLSLINNMLDQAKIEAGRFELQLVQVDISTLLKDIGDQARSVAATRDIEISLSGDALAAHAHADHGALLKILHNLLDNAIKFTPDGGHIQISVDRDGENLRFGVLDSGVGLSSEDREHIFEPFRRGSRAQSASAGAGIGLALCANLVRLHGGAIWAESAPGSGAHFQFTLPATDPNIQAQA